MAIIQALARIYRLPDNLLLGEGQCALYISSPSEQAPGPISGTIVVEWVGEDRLELSDDGGHQVRLADGRWLNVVFTRRQGSEEGPEVLRFRGAGPLRRSTPASSSA